MAKNILPVGLVNQSPLLKQLLEDGNTEIILCDVRGGYHFNGDFRNADDVREAVQRLAATDRYKHLLNDAENQLASMFENIFCHHQFTGRSETFFAYEGLGSIYWHMVSKLALAVIETIVEARKAGTEIDPLHLGRLLAHYREIRFGIGATKSPAEYGAFPTDPYSHTPAHTGAQQPGMTGQVKEDILARFHEIGVRIHLGQLSFDPTMLERAEYARAEEMVADTTGTMRDVLSAYPTECPVFVFSLLGIPVIYSLGSPQRLTVHFTNGSSESNASLSLTAAQTADLFKRSEVISWLEVCHPLAIDSNE
jgi:hypothetical protein